MSDIRLQGGESVWEVLCGVKRKMIKAFKILGESGYIWGLLRQNAASEDYLNRKSYKDILPYSSVDISLYKKILDKIFSENVKRLKKKERIEIGFLAPFADTWSCDMLFQLLMSDERFHPYIIVTPFYNGNSQSEQEIYRYAQEFFQKKGYPLKYAVEPSNGREFTLDELGRPDILFHLSPYNESFPKALNIRNIPLGVLNVNIPYGLYIASLPDFQFQLESFYTYWKIFDLPFFCKLSEKYCKLGDFNRVGSGYCKLDKFYIKENINQQYYWKKPDVVKIIYAPHHSLGNIGQCFSTFDKNYREILQLAKENADTTCWVVKPHPLLKKTSVEQGVFQTEQEYDDYMNEWNNMPNARVVTGGDYLPLFKTSDCLILDCDSFLGEYLYVNKPLLFLTRPEQNMGELGMEIMKAVYTAPGEDVEGIGDFIKLTVTERRDQLKEKREECYDRCLNYYKMNGNRYSSEFIYDYLIKSFDL